MEKHAEYVIQPSDAEFVEVICDKSHESRATGHAKVIVIPKDGCDAAQILAVTAARRVAVTVTLGSNEPFAIGLFDKHKRCAHKEYTIDFTASQYEKVLGDIKDVCEEYILPPKKQHTLPPNEPHTVPPKTQHTLPLYEPHKLPPY